MIKKKLNLKFFFIFIFGLLSYSSCNRSLHNSTFYHDNLNRTHVHYKPVNLPENAPLVFVLHSYGRYAKGHMPSLQLDSIAEINKFVVCYPQGTLDINTGEPYWTGGLATSSIDDIGYLTKLAKHLQTKYELDMNLIRTELLFAAFPMELL